MFEPVTHTTAAQGAKSSVLGWSMVLFFVALNISGALLLKNEIQKIGNWNLTFPKHLFFCFLRLVCSWKIILSIVSLLGSTIAWSIALANLELSRAYPVGIGLHFLAVMTSSMFLYGESFTIFKALGIILILLGVASILK